MSSAPRTSFTASGIISDPSGGSGRVIPESRRADGSIRKERRVKPGFTPNEDVARFRPSVMQRRDQEGGKLVPGSAARARTNGVGHATPQPPPPPSGSSSRLPASSSPGPSSPSSSPFSSPSKPSSRNGSSLPSSASAVPSSSRPSSSSPSSSSPAAPPKTRLASRALAQALGDANGSTTSASASSSAAGQSGRTATASPSQDGPAAATPASSRTGSSSSSAADSSDNWRRRGPPSAAAAAQPSPPSTRDGRVRAKDDQTTGSSRWARPEEGARRSAEQQAPRSDGDRDEVDGLVQGLGALDVASTGDGKARQAR